MVAALPSASGVSASLRGPVAARWAGRSPRDGPADPAAGCLDFPRASRHPPVLFQVRGGGGPKGHAASYP